MDLFHSAGFASYVTELMDQQHVPGLAIAIVHNDEIASAGYGHASLDPEIPCTADTLFDIASSAKSLTAAAVGLLVDDNDMFPDIQYDAVMSTLLPEDFVMSGEGYTEGVTVEDILSHRSGMPRHDDSYMSVRAAKPDNARSITRNLRNLPVAAPIRSKYIYCNMMYTVATHLVEVKSGQDFGTFLEERIFKPLDMASTTLQPSSARSKGFGSRMATGYTWKRANSTYRGLESPDCPEGQGAGSIISSVNDFIKFVKAFMNREDPINKNVYEGLTRLRTFVNPNPARRKRHSSPVAYAAGLDIYFYKGHMVVGHNGVFSGFASRFFFLPDFSFGAVIMGNSDGANGVATTLVQKLIDNILGVTDETPQDSKSKDTRSVEIRGPEPQAEAKDTNPMSKNQEKKEKKKQEKKTQAKKSQGIQKGQVNEQKPKRNTPQPPTIPLSAYAGNYWNPGYHNLLVQIRDDALFIDATDRSMGFTLKFEHVSDDRKFDAHLTDWLDGSDDIVKAEFVIEDAQVTRLGLQLEEMLKEMIWFEKKDGVRSGAARVQNPLFGVMP
ncbi:beta-lactamase/transpeptidase-like protein [Aspergillus tubingensis]|uniref:beta-lactamase/transpeptidase-like protein n=1 Tax=Aspergillus tubingensis TaxID=5068 RepID=UPI001578886C|nr:beta-lactamase/transpeptidase-like protein [Aspergillus tubingensis]GFN12662.1 beta-lactamase/transpeptidase-like protein [Aspergillus tubingensis]